MENQNYFAWFIIQVKHLRENKAKELIYATLLEQELLHTVKSILIPTQEIIESHQKTPKKKIKKIFPGYLIAEMQPYPEIVNIILNTNHVVNFLGFDKRKVLMPDPVTNLLPLQPLSADEVEMIMGTVNPSKQTRTHADDFQIGEIVRIIEGLFKDFKGSVRKINSKKNSCILDVYILGRATPVELSFFQIEKEY